MLNTPNYTDLLNVIIEWGKTHLLTPVFVPYLHELEKEYKELLKEAVLDKFKQESIGEIRSSVTSAIKTLSNPELITATEGDDIWHEAEESFIAFDRVNYLMDAAYYLIARDDDNKLSREVSANLDEIMDSITSWLEDGNFSAMRLTVLNDIRRGYLGMIPEDKRYLFPWYEIYSDYDEGILTTLIENYDRLTLGNKEGIPETLKTNLAEILYELKKDTELFSIIKREVILHRGLLEAVSKRSVLTLWRLGEDSALDYHLPVVVEKAGVVRVSIKVVRDASISSEADKLYWAFLTAFCGPNLSDNQRITLLDKVEKGIGNIDASVLTGDMANILNLLQRWYKGGNIDSWLVEKSFTTWLQHLKAKAINLPAMEYDEEPDRLWEILQGLLKAPILPDFVSRVWQRVRDGIISPQPSLHVARARDLDEEIQQAIAIETNTNPITLSLKPTDNGEYFFLTSPESNYLSECNDINAYRNLWDKIDDTEGLYWGGCAISADNKLPEIFTPQKITKRTFYRLKDNNYCNVVIGISADKKLIEKFTLEKIEANNANIIVLICSLKGGGNS